MQIVNSCNFSKDNLTTRRYGNWVWVISLVPQNIYLCMYISWFRIFFRLLVSRWREVYSLPFFEDIKFKIPEGYEQNWSFSVSTLLAVSVSTVSTGQRQKNLNFGPSLLKFQFKVLKYQWTNGGTMMSKFGDTPNIYMTNPKIFGSL